MITFTQGDNAILNLTAQDGNGNPINLTGASFSSQILGANGAGVVTFGNSQHTVIDVTAGTFQLTLSPTDTAACGLGDNKEIVTTIVQSSLPVAYHGVAILKVLPAVPLQ